MRARPEGSQRIESVRAALGAGAGAGDGDAEPPPRRDTGVVRLPAGPSPCIHAFPGHNAEDGNSAIESIYQVPQGPRGDGERRDPPLPSRSETVDGRL